MASCAGRHSPLLGCQSITDYIYQASCQLDQQYANSHYSSPIYSFCKKILSKEYINFLNFFQMYFTGVVLTVMLQVFQLTQLLQVTLVPTARCVIQSHFSLLENKGISSLRLSQSRKVMQFPKAGNKFVYTFIGKIFL